MQGILPCIPDSHLYRVTNTRCRIGMAFYPNDGHIVARKVYRKAINILRKFVHQVGSVCKIILITTRKFLGAGGGDLKGIVTSKRSSSGLVST